MKLSQLTKAKTLAQRLRDKESRDNRALLDEAADAIEQLTEDKSCAWCRGEQKLVDERYRRAEIASFPAPHILIGIRGHAMGLSINYCPLCGRCLNEVSHEMPL